MNFQLTLGRTIKKVVLKLPAGWGDRTQTMSISGSTDNITYNEIVSSATYSFLQSDSNVVTILFPPTTARYVRLNITANSAAGGAQAAEFEVY